MSTREISTASTTEAKDLPSLPLAEMPLPRGLALPVPQNRVETKIPLVLGKIDGQPADLRVTHFRTNRY
jgi:hypothetical protein